MDYVRHDKQVCVGKMDPATGNYLPSKRLDPQQAVASDPFVTASAQVVGPSVILDEFSKRTGLEKLLKTCFPDFHPQMLAMANYLALQGGALSHCSSWAKSHLPDLATSLSSQRISEIHSSIGINGKQTFLAKWIKNVSVLHHPALEMTDISVFLNDRIPFRFLRT